jgi:hypothetical protein
MSIMHELTVEFFASQAFSITIVLVADAQKIREETDLYSILDFISAFV